MPGSTGIISGVYAGSATTLLEEDQRIQESSIGSMPGLQQTRQQIVGQILEVHESAPLIKGIISDGKLIANGKWIPLIHSLDEIVERFGTVRKGMTIMVSYTGPDGADAMANIIGIPGEKPGEGRRRSNEVQKTLYAIFTPGSSGS